MGKNKQLSLGSKNNVQDNLSVQIHQDLLWSLKDLSNVIKKTITEEANRPALCQLLINYQNIIKNYQKRINKNEIEFKEIMRNVLQLALNFSEKLRQYNVEFEQTGVIVLLGAANNLNVNALCGLGEFFNSKSNQYAENDKPLSKLYAEKASLYFNYTFLVCKNINEKTSQIFNLLAKLYERGFIPIGPSENKYALAHEYYKQSLTTLCRIERITNDGKKTVELDMKRAADLYREKLKSDGDPLALENKSLVDFLGAVFDAKYQVANYYLTHEKNYTLAKNELLELYQVLSAEPYVTDLSTMGRIMFALGKTELMENNEGAKERAIKYFQEATQFKNVDAMREFAQLLDDEGNYVEAAFVFKQIVETEGVDIKLAVIAHMHLGKYYTHGEGVVPNSTLAILHYIKASKLGEPHAYIKLGRLLELQKKYDQAFKAYDEVRKLIESVKQYSNDNDIRAQLNKIHDIACTTIASLQLNGLVDQISQEDSIEYLKKASTNHPNASFMLAQIYGDGRYGVERNRDLAISYYRQSIDLFNIGLLNERYLQEEVAEVQETINTCRTSIINLSQLTKLNDLVNASVYFAKEINSILEQNVCADTPPPALNITFLDGCDRLNDVITQIKNVESHAHFKVLCYLLRSIIKDHFFMFEKSLESYVRLCDLLLIGKPETVIYFLLGKLADIVESNEADKYYRQFIESSVFISGSNYSYDELIQYLNSEVSDPTSEYPYQFYRAQLDARFQLAKFELKNKKYENCKALLSKIIEDIKYDFVKHKNLSSHIDVLRIQVESLRLLALRFENDSSSYEGKLKEKFDDQIRDDYKWAIQRLVDEILGESLEIDNIDDLKILMKYYKLLTDNVINKELLISQIGLKNLYVVRLQEDFESKIKFAYYELASIICSASTRDDISLYTLAKYFKNRAEDKTINHTIAEFYKMRASFYFNETYEQCKKLTHKLPSNYYIWAKLLQDGEIASPPGDDVKQTIIKRYRDCVNATRTVIELQQVILKDGSTGHLKATSIFTLQKIVDTYREALDKNDQARICILDHLIKSMTLQLDAKFQLVRLYEADEQYELARTELESLYQLLFKEPYLKNQEPLMGNVLSWLGILYCKLDLSEKLAKAYFGKAREFDCFDGEFEYGCLLEESGEYDRAAEAYEKFIQHNAGKSQLLSLAYQSLGDLYYKRQIVVDNYLDKAVSYYQDSAKLGNPYAHHRLAGWCEDQKKYDEAYLHYDQIVKITAPDAQSKVSYLSKNDRHDLYYSACSKMAIMQLDEYLSENVPKIDAEAYLIKASNGDQTACFKLGERSFEQQPQTISTLESAKTYYLKSLKFIKKDLKYKRYNDKNVALVQARVELINSKIAEIEKKILILTNPIKEDHPTQQEETNLNETIHENNNHTTKDLKFIIDFIQACHYLKDEIKKADLSDLDKLKPALDKLDRIDFSQVDSKNETFVLNVYDQLTSIIKNDFFDAYSTLSAHQDLFQLALNGNAKIVMQFILSQLTQISGKFENATKHSVAFVGSKIKIGNKPYTFSQLFSYLDIEQYVSSEIKKFSEAQLLSQFQLAKLYFDKLDYVKCREKLDHISNITKYQFSNHPDIVSYTIKIRMKAACLFGESLLGQDKKSKKHAAKAEEYFKLSAELGHIHAYFHLGVLYKESARYDEALLEFSKAKELYTVLLNSAVNDMPASEINAILMNIEVHLDSIKLSIQPTNNDAVVPLPQALPFVEQELSDLTSIKPSNNTEISNENTNHSQNIILDSFQETNVALDENIQEITTSETNGTSMDTEIHLDSIKPSNQPIYTEAEIPLPQQAIPSRGQDTSALSSSGPSSDAEISNQNTDHSQITTLDSFQEIKVAELDENIHEIPLSQLGIEFKELPPIASQVVDLFYTPEDEVYVCGGWVRDQFLLKKYNDIDLAVAQSQPEIVATLEKNDIPYTVEGDKNFPIVKVISGEDIVEIHHRSGTISAEIMQGDATINSFLYNPKKKTLLYANDRLNDILYPIIKLVGEPNLNIQSDPTRILRVIHLAAKTNLYIDNESYYAIANNAYLLSSSDVDKTKLFTLTMKLFCGPDAENSYSLMMRLHVFSTLFPRIYIALSENSLSGLFYRNLFHLLFTEKRNEEIILLTLLWIHCEELKNEYPGYSLYDLNDLAIAEFSQTLNFNKAYNPSLEYKEKIKKLLLLVYFPSLKPSYPLLSSTVDELKYLISKTNEIVHYQQIASQYSYNNTQTMWNLYYEQNATQGYHQPPSPKIPYHAGRQMWQPVNRAGTGTTSAYQQYDSEQFSRPTNTNH